MKELPMFFTGIVFAESRKIDNLIYLLEYYQGEIDDLSVLSEQDNKLKVERLSSSKTLEEIFTENFIDIEIVPPTKLAFLAIQAFNDDGDEDLDDPDWRDPNLYNFDLQDVQHVVLVMNNIPILNNVKTTIQEYFKPFIDGESVARDVKFPDYDE